MEEQKIDRRVRKTKKVLLQALTKLMSEKKINSITVKEVTDLADVNRSTFYLYYKDIFDMVEKIETEMFNEFSEAFDTFTKKGPNNDNVLSFFIYVFEFVQVNADMCKILLGPDGDYAFIEKFKDAIKQYQPPIENPSSRLKCQYFLPFVMSGYIGIIQQWLNDDMKAPPKAMAATVFEMLQKLIL